MPVNNVPQNMYLNKRILVTGGAGFIGSHTCLELLSAGYEVAVIDNLSNSKEEPLRRVEKLSGRPLKFYKADLCDKDALGFVFADCRIDAVIHFAGLKAVDESVRFPVKYYVNNLYGALNLIEIMMQYGVHDLVFSSSATVYGNPRTVPVTENSPLQPVNPYGRSKLMIEEILRDLFRSKPGWNIALLRYFNPVGAHPGGRIGEDPNGIPNNLFPCISRVAAGRCDELMIFGDDYPTPDGTGIRDYIHVVDLALGHIKTLEKLQSGPGLVTYNLGTGRGYSVLDVVRAFERACGFNIPYRITKRRAGDVPVCYADPGLAHRELGWESRMSLEEMCADAWRWQSSNPNGYE